MSDPTRRYERLAIEDRKDLCRERLATAAESAQALYDLADDDLCDVLDDLYACYAGISYELVDSQVGGDFEAQDGDGEEGGAA